MTKFVNYIILRLGNSIQIEKNLPTDCLIDVINEDKIELLFYDMRRPFLKFISKGYIGIFLYDSRTRHCISYGWLCPSSSVKPQHLAKSYRDMKVWWIYNCRVLEKYRGRGYYQLLLVEMIKYIDSVDSNPAIWIDTTDDNQASLRAIRKVGFRFVATQTNLVAPSLRKTASQLFKRTK